MAFEVSLISNLLEASLLIRRFEEVGEAEDWVVSGVCSFVLGVGMLLRRFCIASRLQDCLLLLLRWLLLAR